MAIVSDPLRAARQCSPSCPRAAWLLALVVLGSVSGPVPAANWTIAPRISVNETFSDNIGLAPPGAERHEFITDVSPGVSIRGQGGRLNLNLFYNLQTLRYARDTSPRSTSHQLQADANAEIIKDIVFLDLGSGVSQQNVSNTGNLGSDNLAATGGRTTVITTSISPVVRHRFGNYADSEARITFNKVDNGDTAGSASKNVVLSLQSGSRFQRLPWQLTITKRTQKNETGGSSTFRRIDVSGRYLITRKYGVTFAAGQESNGIASSRADTGGRTWRLGGTWSPTPRTDFEVGLSKRFFDTSLFMNFSHRARRTVFAASFEQDATTTSQLQEDRLLIPLIDAFGVPIVDPATGNLLLVPTDAPSLTDEVLIRQSFTGSVTFQGKRTNASVSFFNESRDFEVTGANETVFGISASASRQLSRATSVSVSGSFQDSELAAGTKQTRWNVGVQASRTFARNLTGNVNLARTRQDSTAIGGDFEENRLSAQLSMTF